MNEIVDLGGIKGNEENPDITTVNIGGLGDVDHDLNTFPYPFEDNSVDEVRIIHTLEHLEKPLRTMEETYRMLKKGGIVKVEVPYWKRFTTFQNPFHLHEFKEEWFKNLNPNSSIYKKSECVYMKKFLPKLNFEIVDVWKRRGKFKLYKIYDMRVTLKKKI